MMKRSTGGMPAGRFSYRIGGNGRQRRQCEFASVVRAERRVETRRWKIGKSACADCNVGINADPVALRSGSAIGVKSAQARAGGLCVVVAASLLAYSNTPLYN